MDLTRLSRYSMESRIIAGLHASSVTGEEVARLGGKKVLVVTDKGIAGAGLVEHVTDSLTAQGVQFAIYDDVQPNPAVEVVDNGFYRLQEESCDSVVALGGGSSIDAAKIIAVLATNGGSTLDYEGPNKFKKLPAPLLAIPTTCGTGAEVTHGAVVTDRKRRIKTIVAGEAIRPKVVILDPALLKTLPTSTTASTGLDALTHAVESYVSLTATPFTDAFSLTAIELIGQNLRVAVANNDLEALMNMLVASTMAGIAFSNARLGILHAMTDILGGMYDVPHGMACAILLPHVMEFNLIGSPHKFAHIASALGEMVEELTVLEAAACAVDAVADLIRSVGLSKQLGDIGVEEDEFPEVAEAAMNSVHVPCNPRRPTAEDLVSILQQAY
jgi:alcohol dehydrogenase class IV